MSPCFPSRSYLTCRLRYLPFVINKSVKVILLEHKSIPVTSLFRSPQWLCMSLKEATSFNELQGSLWFVSINSATVSPSIFLLAHFTPFSLVFFFFLFLKNSPKVLILRPLLQVFLLSLSQIRFLANSSISSKSLLKFLPLKDIYDINPFHTGPAHLPSL